MKPEDLKSYKEVFDKPLAPIDMYDCPIHIQHYQERLDDIAALASKEVRPE